MGDEFFTHPTPKAISRAARGQIEAALEHAHWPWALHLSRWIDALLELEES